MSNTAKRVIIYTAPDRQNNSGLSKVTSDHDSIGISGIKVLKPIEAHQKCLMTKCAGYQAGIQSYTSNKTYGTHVGLQFP